MSPGILETLDIRGEGEFAAARVRFPDSKRSSDLSREVAQRTTLGEAQSVDLNDGEIQQSPIDLTSLVRAYMRAHQ
jgi:hypothetical protein